MATQDTNSPLRQVPAQRQWRYRLGQRLRALGYRNYASYLHSGHWRATRARYRESDRPQACFCCDAPENVDLHHRTYDNLGAEPLDDLVPLCRRCHNAVHVLERRGDVGLDLVGLMDQARAAGGRALLERRAAESFSDRRAALDDLLYRLGELTSAERIRRAQLAARERRVDITRQEWVLRQVMGAGRSARAINGQIMALERVAYAREFMWGEPSCEAVAAWRDAPAPILRAA